MKWIGQHIWDFISRFRTTVYIENLETSSEENVLVVDSDGKVTKNTSLGGSDVTMTNGVDNRVMTATSAAAINGEANLTFDGDNLTVNSSSSEQPVLTLKNTNTTVTSCAQLKFLKDAADTEDDELLGRITFRGEDEGNNETNFASILAQISESDETDEAGNLILAVATSDGTTTTNRNFASGYGHKTGDYVDVTIGYGTSSTTTIAGNLAVNGTTTAFTDATGPIITLENSADNSTGAFLLLRNSRGGSDAVDNDNLGAIIFSGVDDGTPNLQYYADIRGNVADATSDQEAGQLELRVAEYDGTRTAGLTLNGDTDADGEIDVTIGAGAASTTTIAGDLTVTSKAIIPTRKFTKTADGTHFEAQGDILYLGGGSTTQGDLCYLKEDGEWGQADADGAATGDDVDRDAMGMLAIALGTDPDVDGMLLRGVITMDYDLTDTGNPIYVSTTAGAITSTAPSASGDFVRVLGYCLDDTNGQIWFNPDSTWVEIA